MRTVYGDYGNIKMGAIHREVTHIPVLCTIIAREYIEGPVFIYVWLQPNSGQRPLSILNGSSIIYRC